MDSLPLRGYYSLMMTSQRLQQQVNCLLNEPEEATSRYDWEALSSAHSIEVLKSSNG